MKKGYIKIPIADVWEIVNKPSRLMRSLYEQVEKLPCDEYEYITLTEDIKSEIIDRLKRAGNTGLLAIPSPLNISNFTVYDHEKCEFIPDAILQMNNGIIRAFTQKYNFSNGQVSFKYYDDITISFS